MEKNMLPYCIELEDYPKLFRYRVTPQGFCHMEEIISQIYLEGKEISMYKLVQLGMLLRVNMCQTMKMDNETLFQDVSKKAAKYGGVEPEYVAHCIKSMVLRGLLDSNPKYDNQIANDLHKLEK
ncbi:hypothetical protein QVH35_09405 [Candidatus Nitrosotenuis chungbukensis]|uniref:hypothetical protein n=1 Tax=Candidatus Nitrosotenuis chungbukensis TaxID=1353246 RepID=UPI0012FEFF15|nr:hypothetical protein [Candidatus Nitrosotenuis chungbukensis]WKT57564.1 hypothetical protein QVH35_09405 [Candidatus Nitrosotenuis chungbukensis]